MKIGKGEVEQRHGTWRKIFGFVGVVGSSLILSYIFSPLITSICIISEIKRNIGNFEFKKVSIGSDDDIDIEVLLKRSSLPLSLRISEVKITFSTTRNEVGFGSVHAENVTYQRVEELSSTGDEKVPGILITAKFKGEVARPAKKLPKDFLIRLENQIIFMLDGKVTFDYFGSLLQTTFPLTVPYFHCISVGSETEEGGMLIEQFKTLKRKKSEEENVQTEKKKFPIRVEEYAIEEDENNLYFTGAFRYAKRMKIGWLSTRMPEIVWEISIDGKRIGTATISEHVIACGAVKMPVLFKMVAGRNEVENMRNSFFKYWQKREAILLHAEAVRIGEEISDLADSFFEVFIREVSQVLKFRFYQRKREDIKQFDFPLFELQFSKTNRTGVYLRTLFHNDLFPYLELPKMINRGKLPSLEMELHLNDMPVAELLTDHLSEKLAYGSTSYLLLEGHAELGENLSSLSALIQNGRENNGENAPPVSSFSLVVRGSERMSARLLEGFGVRWVTEKGVQVGFAYNYSASSSSTETETEDTEYKIAIKIMPEFESSDNYIKEEQGVVYREKRKAANVQMSLPSVREKERENFMRIRWNPAEITAAIDNERVEVDLEGSYLDFLFSANCGMWSLRSVQNVAADIFTMGQESPTEFTQLTIADIRIKSDGPEEDNRCHLKTPVQLDYLGKKKEKKSVMARVRSLIQTAEKALEDVEVNVRMPHKREIEWRIKSKKDADGVGKDDEGNIRKRSGIFTVLWSLVLPETMFHVVMTHENNPEEMKENTTEIDTLDNIKNPRYVVEKVSVMVRIGEMVLGYRAYPAADAENIAASEDAKGKSGFSIRGAETSEILEGEIKIERVPMGYHHPGFTVGTRASKLYPLNENLQQLLRIGSKMSKGAPKEIEQESEAQKDGAVVDKEKTKKKEEREPQSTKEEARRKEQSIESKKNISFDIDLYNKCRKYIECVFSVEVKDFELATEEERKKQSSKDKKDIPNIALPYLRISRDVSYLRGAGKDVARGADGTLGEEKARTEETMDIEDEKNLYLLMKIDKVIANTISTPEEEKFLLGVRGNIKADRETKVDVIKLSKLFNVEIGLHRNNRSEKKFSITTEHELFPLIKALISKMKKKNEIAKDAKEETETQYNEEKHSPAEIEIKKVEACVVEDGNVVLCIGDILRVEKLTDSLVAEVLRECEFRKKSSKPRKFFTTKYENVATMYYEDPIAKKNFLPISENIRHPLFAEKQERGEELPSYSQIVLGLEIRQRATSKAKKAIQELAKKAKPSIESAMRVRRCDFSIHIHDFIVLEIDPKLHPNSAESPESEINCLGGPLCVILKELKYSTSIGGADVDENREEIMSPEVLVLASTTGSIKSEAIFSIIYGKHLDKIEPSVKTFLRELALLFKKPEEMKEMGWLIWAGHIVIKGLNKAKNVVLSCVVKQPKNSSNIPLINMLQDRDKMTSVYISGKVAESFFTWIKKVTTEASAKEAKEDKKEIKEIKDKEDNETIEDKQKKSVPLQPSQIDAENSIKERKPAYINKALFGRLLSFFVQSYNAFTLAYKKAPEKTREEIEIEKSLMGVINNIREKKGDAFRREVSAEEEEKVRNRTFVVPLAKGGSINLISNNAMFIVLEYKEKAFAFISLAFKRESDPTISLIQFISFHLCEEFEGLLFKILDDLMIDKKTVLDLYLVVGTERIMHRTFYFSFPATSFSYGELFCEGLCTLFLAKTIPTLTGGLKYAKFGDLVDPHDYFWLFRYEFDPNDKANTSEDISLYKHAFRLIEPMSYVANYVIKPKTQ